MKYIKLFEHQQKRKRIERKVLKKSKLSDNYSIPVGSYVIFLNSEQNFKINKKIELLVLGKLMSYEHVINKTSTYRDEFKTNIYIKMYIIDINHLLMKNKIQELNSPLKEVLYTTTSLKDAVKEFERIKTTEPYCNWEMYGDVEKYNM